MNNRSAESEAAANAAADAAASQAAFNFLSSSMNNPPFTVNPNNTQGNPSNLGPLNEGSMLASDPNSNLADPHANMNAFSGQSNDGNSLLMPSWQPQQQSNDPNGFMNDSVSSSFPNGMWSAQPTNDGGFGSPESINNNNNNHNHNHNLQQHSGSVDPSYLSSMYNMSGLPMGVAPDSAPAGRNPSSMSSESDQTTPLQRHMSMASTAPTSNPSRGDTGLGTSLDQSSSSTGPGTTAAFGSAGAANAAQPFTSSANPEMGRAGPSPVFGQGPFPPFVQPPPHLARQWNSVEGRPFPPYPHAQGVPIPFNRSSLDSPRPPFPPYGRSPMFPQGIPSPYTADMAMAAVMGQTWPPKGDPNMFNKHGMGDIAEYPTGPAMWGPPGPGTDALSTSPSHMGPTGSPPFKPDYRVTPSGGVVKGATFLSRNILPPTALGGHAASHPPGLGNRVLRDGSGFGSGISMAGVPQPHRSSGPQGPHPASNQGMGYGGTTTSASVTDFTKRKGWPMRVVDELSDFVHVLDPKGSILFASSSIGDLTGWKPEELRGKDLAEMVHPDDATTVRERLDPTIQVPGADVIMYIRFRCKPDRASTRKGARASDPVGELSSMGGDSSSTGSSRMGASSSASGASPTSKRKKTKATAPTVPGRVVANNVPYVVFEFTGHPYFPPADLAELVKERKAVLAAKEDKNKGLALAGTEAETQVEGLPKVEDEPMDDLPALTADKDLGLQCFFCSCRVHPTPNISVLDSFLNLKVENERLRLMLQKLNMEDEAAAAAASSLSTVTPEPFPPSSRTSNLTSKSMRPGHRSSSSISTKPPSDPEDDKHKKKKAKTTEEGDYVCADCGRADSPEWRKGPLGPKTLCNACGLRWAKRIKRKGGDPNAAALAFHQQASAAAQHHAVNPGPPPPFMMGPQPG